MDRPTMDRNLIMRRCDYCDAEHAEKVLGRKLPRSLPVLELADGSRWVQHRMLREHLDAMVARQEERRRGV